MPTLGLFRSDPARHDGVRPLHRWLLRIVYGLMLAGMGPTAWSALLQHRGPWEPLHAVAFCVWAAYASLSLFGLRHPLRMLPIVLFMILYKSLWLAVVAWPLWRAGTLAGSPAEELAWLFVAAPALALAVPWGYVLRHYVTGRRLDAAAPAARPVAVR